MAQSPGTAASPATTKPAEKDCSDETSSVPNPFLTELKKELDSLYTSNNSMMDGFLLYLYAVITRDFNSQCGPHLEALVSLDSLLHPERHPTASFDNHILLPHHTLKSKSNDRALRVFMESLCLFPYNWSCWLELCSLLMASDIFLPAKSDFSVV